MRCRKRFAIVAACAIAGVLAPALAKGAATTVAGDKGTIVSARGSAASLATDPDTGLPGSYYRIDRGVAVVYTDEWWWYNAGVGPGRHAAPAALAGGTGVWVHESDIGDDPLDDADDVYTDFVPDDDAACYVECGKGGRAASVKGPVSGTLRVWYGKRFAWTPWGANYVRSADFQRPAMMHVDVEWAATDAAAPSREVIRTADGGPGVTRTALESYAAGAVGSIVGDDGKVWWDGAFDGAGITHFGTFGVAK